MTSCGWDGGSAAQPPCQPDVLSGVPCLGPLCPGPGVCLADGPTYQQADCWRVLGVTAEWWGLCWRERWPSGREVQGLLVRPWQECADSAPHTRPAHQAVLGEACWPCLPGGPWGWRVYHKCRVGQVQAAARGWGQAVADLGGQASLG